MAKSPGRDEKPVPALPAGDSEPAPWEKELQEHAPPVVPEIIPAHPVENAMPKPHPAKHGEQSSAKKVPITKVPGPRRKFQ